MNRLFPKLFDHPNSEFEDLGRNGWKCDLGVELNVLPSIL